MDKSQLRDQQIPTCLYEETFSSSMQITHATIFLIKRNFSLFHMCDIGVLTVIMQKTVRIESEKLQMTPTESYNILVYSMSLQPGSMLTVSFILSSSAAQGWSLLIQQQMKLRSNQSNNATNEYFTHYIKFIELSDHSKCFQYKHQRFNKLLLKVI